MSAGIELVTVDDPEAGAGWSVEVPAGETWEVLSVAALFDTSSDAGNRRLVVSIEDDQARTLVASPANSAVTASVSDVVVNAFAGSESVSWTSGAMALGFPNFYPLPAGWKIAMTAGGIDDGDQFHDIVIRARIHRAASPVA
jgi:hypothetical protein